MTTVKKGKRSRHYPITKPQAEILLGLNPALTAAEWRIFIYLVTLDPFGDIGVKFNAEELMLACNIKKPKYREAKNKFEKLGLFEFTEGIGKVRNLQGIRASRACEKSDPNGSLDDPNGSLNDPNGSPNDPNGSLDDPFGSHRDSKPKPRLSLVIPHTLSDFNQTNSNSLTKPTHHPEEREIFVDLENIALEAKTPHLQEKDLGEIKPKNSPQSSPQIKVITEDPIQVPQPPDSAEFLNFVLQSEVMTLPNPPESETGRKRLAKTFIARDQDGDLVRAFQKWQRQQAELEARRAAIQAEALEPLPQKRTLGSELKRLQELFNCKVRAVQDTVIARAKALRFLITESGLELPPHLDPSMPLATWEALPCL